MSAVSQLIQWKEGEPHQEFLPLRESLAHLYRESFLEGVNDRSLFSHWTFFDDFPIWDPQQKNLDRWQVIGKNESVGSTATPVIVSASIRLAHLKVSGYPPLSVALLGAVATDLNERGKGLATLAIQKLLESDWIKKRAPSAVILWGSQKNLYSRFGFEYGGIQKRTFLKNLGFSKLESQLQTGATSTTDVDIQWGWDLSIFQWMLNRSDGLYYQQEDLHWIQSHQNTQWIRLERDQKICAYVGLNRGIDLGGVIHEWGGSETDLALLLNALRKESPGLQVIYHPNAEEKYSFFKEAHSVENDRLCMVKWMPNSDGLGREELLERFWFYGLDSC